MSMTTPSTLGLAGSQAGLAADARSLDGLKHAAGSDPKAIKEAARQFESLFMRELIKSMREATMKSGMMESQGENISTDLLDQQLSVSLSGRPGGLSELIERQLLRQGRASGSGPAPGENGSEGSTLDTFAYGRSTRLSSLGPPLAPNATPSERQENFVRALGPAAQRVQQESGIPASYMLGQAGHETGWGRSEILRADGSPSYNLFGIKATGGWKGAVAEVTTTEYIDGEPHKVSARFRAYDSYEDSLRDYASLITNSPRYAQVADRIGAHTPESFATELQRAGYATDPAYAGKLSRAINTALAVRRAF